ncbi:MAG: superfamily domain, partial [Acidobacteria bacterium]|nr:superfamily domain [Acidobacteriota bacterium]
GIAAAAGLGFLFVQDERYDLAVPDARRSRPAVAALLALLQDAAVRDRLRGLGFTA